MVEGLPELPARAFEKVDTGDDLDFYAPPRLVTHIEYLVIIILFHRHTIFVLLMMYLGLQSRRMLATKCFRVL